MTPFDYAGWQTGLIQDVRQGLVSEKRIDQSVRRILRLKFQLGLFDHPYVDPSEANAAVQAGRDATLEGGPGVDHAAAQPEQHAAAGAERQARRDRAERRLDDQPARRLERELAGRLRRRPRLLHGAAGPDPARHHRAQGPAGRGSERDVSAPDQASAVAAAASADAVVVAVGEKAYAEGLGDNPAPALPPDQKALISALQATGKPVIVVVIAGRPLGLGPARTTAALLMAYQGSTEAGTAVADVIFGKVNPSGQLPVSWPSEADAPGGDFCGDCPSPLGDQPKFFDQLPDTGSGQGTATTRCYPFGFGLSYTTFQTSGSRSTSSRREARRRDRDVHGDEHRQPRRHRGRAGLRAPAGQRRRRAAAAAGRIRAHDAAVPASRKTVHVSFPVSELAVTPGTSTAPRDPRSSRARIRSRSAR